MGEYKRKGISTNAEAEAWVNRGLIWMYCFNHEEALRCLKLALTLEKDCVFAWILMAYCHGPNYNLSQDNVYYSLSLQQDTEYPSQREAVRALDTAIGLSSVASKLELALIDALRLRTFYNNQFAVLSIESFAKAMCQLQQEFCDDPDVTCFAAEAVMQISPWKHFDKDGKSGPHVANIKKLLEHGLSICSNHPGLNHFKVHLLEMSTCPEDSLDAADRLRRIAPDCGHLLHMPSHIDVQTGNYQAAVDSNRNAMSANRKLLKFNQEHGFEANLYLDYIAHDLHMMVFAAMLAGMKQVATDAANELYDLCSKAIFEHRPRAIWLDLFCGIKFHVLIRFGLWEEIILVEESITDECFVGTATILHYAKGLAFAALGNMKMAKLYQDKFEKCRLSPSVCERVLHNNNAKDMFHVGSEMLLGEILYRQGDFDEAFAHLLSAVGLEDELPYDEPPGQMQPIRHALGGLLLEQQRCGFAEGVFRDDLTRHPKNPWALCGLIESLSYQGIDADEIRASLDDIIEIADVPIRSSCACVGRKIVCH